MQRLPARVLVAQPWYQTLPGECLTNTEGIALPPDEAVILPHGEAFVDRSFTNCWAKGLSMRRQTGLTHFGMVHVDVEVLKTGWLSLLMDELERQDADLLSVVLPIKSAHGYTSTAVMDEQGRWRRLTMQEVAAIPFVTFDAAQAGFPGCRLLTSTGLWVARFTEEWCERCWFETRTRLVKRGPDDFAVEHFPEDWSFALKLHAAGRRVLATTLLDCNHWGMAPYPNYRGWGTEPHDAWSAPCWLHAPQEEIAACL